MYQMTKTLKYIAAALLVTGCTADDLTENRPEEVLVPICFSSGLEVQTRAHTGMDAQLPQGQSVAFYVDNATTSVQLYGNNVLTTNSTDGFTGGSPMYFPATDNVDIYAIHPNFGSGDDFPGTGGVATGHVATNQTTAADYYTSDFLYAASRNVSKTPSAVPMNFYHMLSKVRIAIKPGTGVPNLTGAELQITGTKLGYNFTPAKTANITQQSARAAMVTASDYASGTVITLSNEASADFTAANVKYNDGIVVPQVVDAGTAFIRISLSDGTELDWKPAAALTLESGKRYTYHITVSLTGLSVTATVDGWEDNIPVWLQRARDLGIAVSKIPAGTFLMGSSDGSNYPSYTSGDPELNTTPAEPNRNFPYENETQHKVTLTKDFWMSKYEITNNQYAAFLNANGIGSDGKWLTGQYPGLPLIPASSASYDLGLHWESDKWVPVNGYGSHPAISVHWYGATEYARWAGGSLPTEAQWEYACRGGQSESLPFGIGTGKILTGNMANYNVQYIYDYDNGGEKNLGTGNGIYLGRTTPVGSYADSNGYGLYDMHGNVFEWCSDWFDSSYYSSSPVTDPTGPETGITRVLRGGSWSGSAQYCRSACRFRRNPGYAPDDGGFRVVFVP